jgi:hypothetical protein
VILRQGLMIWARLIITARELVPETTLYCGLITHTVPHPPPVLQLRSPPAEAEPYRLPLASSVKGPDGEAPSPPPLKSWSEEYIHPFGVCESL